MSRRPVVAVVGGGISGLAAAHRLATAPDGPRVVLLEAGERFGGKVRSAEIAGVTVDAGPDSLLARVPWAREFLEELNLGEEVVVPAPVDAHIWVRGRLCPLPTGLMTGHAGATAIRRSGLLTARGQLRAALDLIGGGRPAIDDESIADALRGRLGAQVVETVAEPLLGGVYAGSAERISCRTVAPALAKARGRGGSLLRALRSGSDAPADAGPAFLSLKGGLWRLPPKVADSLAAAGADVRLSAKVTSVTHRRDGVMLSLEGGEQLEVDAVILALPARATASLLTAVVPAAATAIGAIEHATVAIATFAFAEAELPALPSSSGFLIAPGQGLQIKACTLISKKWPDPTADGLTLLRCSLGRAGEPPPPDDSELLQAARRDLSTILKLQATPLDARVSRFREALPQLAVGHLDRLAAIEAEVEAAAPRVVMTGAWMRGIGLATCIRDARKAADSAIIRASNSDRGR